MAGNPVDSLKRMPHLVAVGKDRSRTLDVDVAAVRERHVVWPDQVGAAAEAYRMLRTQVLRRARERHMRMIGIASPADGDGKTLTAVNLALAIASEPNQTVLLLDLDFRRSSLSHLLGIAPAPGVVAALRGEVQFADAMCRPAGIERLVIAPAGERVEASSELLASPAAREKLQEIKARYDDRLILVDLPPVLLSDDFLTLAPLLDGVLLVVSEGKTRREDVVRARELMTQVATLGVVLNRARDSEQRAY